MAFSSATCGSRVLVLIGVTLCTPGCGDDARTDSAHNEQSEPAAPPKANDPKPAEGAPTETDPVWVEILSATCSDAGVLTVAVQFTPLGDQPAYLYLPDASFGCGIGGDLKASRDDGRLVLDLSYYPRLVPPRLVDGPGPREMAATAIGKPGDQGALRGLTFTFCFPLSPTDETDRPHVVPLPDGEIPIQMVFGIGTEHPNEFRRPIEGPNEVAVQQKWVEWQIRVRTRPCVVKFPTKKTAE